MRVQMKWMERKKKSADIIICNSWVKDGMMGNVGHLHSISAYIKNWNRWLMYLISAVVLSIDLNRLSNRNV